MYMVFFLHEFGHSNHKNNISSHLPLLLSSPADRCGFIHLSVDICLWGLLGTLSMQLANLSFAFIGLWSKNVKPVPGVYCQCV